MISAKQREAFETRTARRPDADGLQADAQAARRGDGEALHSLAAALAHCAFAAPETAPAVYAALRSVWLGGSGPIAVPAAAPAELSRAFWTAFWELQDARRAGQMDALAITSRVAALGGFLDPSLRARAEAIAATHPKAGQPATCVPPPRHSLDALARQPEGSLARDFWRQIVENKFDLEVLDRETLNLSALPPALRYLNTRILQMHDIWHLVGGFRTTALHEIAISAFQQAQFGHGYSAMFLAVIVSGAALHGGDGTAVVLQTIAEASHYGFCSPSFMAISWEQEWHEPLAAIRARHNITPFNGSHPADYFERLRAVA